MLCERCKKNESSLVVTKTVNGKKSDFSLCYKCSLDMDSPSFLLSNIFSTILELAQASIKSEINCEGCGCNISDLNKKGKIGCFICYQTFETEIRHMVEDIQWGKQHKGKIPRKIEKDLLLKNKVKDLRKQLEKAVKLEDYKLAAVLRDEIKLIEWGIDWKKVQGSIAKTLDKKEEGGE